MQKKKTLFDIIGPIMIGPSSSHTAGAIRIGFLAGKIYGKIPQKVHFRLYNSFAKTGKGHGTDKALLGGVLGYNVDSDKVKDIFTIAEKMAVKYSFEFLEDFSKHPNSVDIIFDDNQKFTISGNSLGGGEVLITEINGYKFNISGNYPTLILIYKDKPGMVYRVSVLIQDENINIASMSCDRNAKGQEASMAICLDTPINNKIVKKLEENKEIYLVRNLEVLK